MKARSLPPLIPAKGWHRVDCWFWNRIGNRFPLFYCDHKLNRLRRVFDAERSQVASEEEKEALWDQERFEAEEFYVEREAILMKLLLDRARKFDVWIGDLPVPSGQESHWFTDKLGNRVLSERSRSALSRATSKARKEHWEFLVKVTVEVIGAVTGLIGAGIGLVALLKK